MRRHIWPASDWSPVWPLDLARQRAVDVTFDTTRHGVTCARTTGTGPHVILLHGITDNRTTWDSLQQRLASVARTHALDLPGHGLSDLPAAPRTLREMAESVVSWLDATRIDRCVVVGNSMGGGVSLALAAHAPDRIAHAILLGSIGIRSPIPFDLALLQSRLLAEQVPWIARIPPVRRMLMQHAVGRGFRPEESVLENYWSGWRVAGRPRYISALTRSIDTGEPTPWLGSIRTPITVVHGEEDTVVPTYVARELALAIRGSRKVMLPGVGHMPQIEATEEIARLVVGAIG